MREGGRPEKREWEREGIHVHAIQQGPVLQHSTHPKSPCFQKSLLICVSAEPERQVIGEPVVNRWRALKREIEEGREGVSLHRHTSTGHMHKHRYIHVYVHKHTQTHAHTHAHTCRG